MRTETLLAVCVAVAVLVTVVAHLLDQLESRSMLTRRGVRLGAVGFVVFVVFSRFAQAL